MRFLLEKRNKMTASSVSAEVVSARSFARIVADSAIIAESIFASIMLSIYPRTMLIQSYRVGVTV